MMKKDKHFLMRAKILQKEVEDLRLSAFHLNSKKAGDPQKETKIHTLSITSTKPSTVAEEEESTS